MINLVNTILYKYYNLIFKYIFLIVSVLYKCNKNNTIFPVYSKFNHNLDINVRNTQIYIQKLNTYGLNTQFDIGNFDGHQFNNTSFYVYF